VREKDDEEAPAEKGITRSLFSAFCSAQRAALAAADAKLSVEKKRPEHIESLV